MRRLLLAVSSMVLIGSWATPAKAQVGGFDDPFFLYYGYYLPQQNFIASIPRQEDTLRSMAVQRQFNAMTERATLTDPGGTLMGYDPLAAYGNNTGSRLPRTISTGVITTHVNGSGPAGYYGRSSAYFPNMRTGGPNRGSRGQQSAIIPSVGPKLDSLGLMQNRLRGRGMGGGGMGGMGGGGGGGFR
jgi:hypothetical protein